LPIDTNIDESDEEYLDIYITSSTSIIEDGLVTYLEEKREDRKINIKSFISIK
jgi:hypothetical protein